MRSILAYALTHIFTLIMDCLFTSRLHSLSLSFNRWCVCSSNFLTLTLFLSLLLICLNVIPKYSTHTHVYKDVYMQPRKAESVPVEIFTIEKNIDTYAFFSHSFFAFFSSGLSIANVSK